MTAKVVVKETVDRFDIFHLGLNVIPPSPELRSGIDPLVVLYFILAMATNPANIDKIGGDKDFSGQVLVIGRNPADILVLEQLSRGGCIPRGMSKFHSIANA